MSQYRSKRQRSGKLSTFQVGGEDYRSIYGGRSTKVSGEAKTTRSPERIVGFPDGIWWVQTESTRRDLAKGVWVSRGRGFGYRVGWYVEGYGFFPTNSYRGRNPVPGTGAISLGGDKYFDEATGTVYEETRKEIRVRPYEDQNTRMRVAQKQIGFSTEPTYVGSYASAESQGIVPRDEIVGTVYNPVNGKILAFGEGHTFSNVGRNMPVEGWRTYRARVTGTNNFGLPYDEVLTVRATSEDTARRYVLGKTREYDSSFSDSGISDLEEA